jgi:hypothetical protein
VGGCAPWGIRAWLADERNRLSRSDFAAAIFDAGADGAADYGWVPHMTATAIW